MSLPLKCLLISSKGKGRTSRGHKHHASSSSVNSCNWHLSILGIVNSWKTDMSLPLKCLLISSKGKGRTPRGHKHYTSSSSGLSIPQRWNKVLLHFLFALSLMLCWVSTVGCNFCEKLTSVLNSVLNDPDKKGEMPSGPLLCSFEDSAFHCCYSSWPEPLKPTCAPELCF